MQGHEGYICETLSQERGGLLTVKSAGESRVRTEVAVALSKDIKSTSKISKVLISGLLTNLAFFFSDAKNLA